MKNSDNREISLRNRIEMLSDTQRSELRECLDAEESSSVRLVAFLKLRETEVHDPHQAIEEIGQDLRERLPAHMIPSSLLAVEELARLPNGKLDRSHLTPLPAEFDSSFEPFVAPRDDVETSLASIWMKLLGMDSVSIHDNFFEVGGDSILSIQFISRAREAGFPLTPHDLISEPTVGRLAQRVHSVRASEAETSAKLRMFSPGTPGNYLLYCDMDQVLDSDLQAVEFGTITIDTEYDGSVTTEEVARRLVEELQKEQPHGPYYIWSQYCGATMALEVAQQLHALGDEVAFLGVVDWQPPTLAASVVHRYLRKALKLARRASFRELLTRAYASLRWRLKRGAGRLLKQDDEYGYTKTTSDYVPRPYHGQISFFISDGYANEQTGRDAIEGWKEIAQGGLDVVELPGGRHPSILEMPHRKELIARIKAK